SLKVRFSDIWYSESIPFRFKNEALKRLAAFDFEALNFIKIESPVSYLTACIAAEYPVSDDFIENLAKKSKSIRELGYIVWCAGKLNKTQLLLKLIDDAEKIEINLPKDVDEFLFEQLNINDLSLNG